MSNRECHKLVSKVLRSLPKETRKAAHEAAHAYIKGQGFDSWRLIEADKIMLNTGVNARSFCRNPRNFTDQPD